MQTERLKLDESPTQTTEQGSALEVLGASTRLGLTSFGGPIAHIGYFRNEYVTRRKWLDEQTFADLVSLCQFLPGPASSQLGIAIGISRAGLLGGLAAWLGFTLPSAIALTLFGLGVNSIGATDSGWVHGLKLVAVAIVAQAVWGMARNLAPDKERGTIAVVAAGIILAWPAAAAQVLIIAVAGLVGWRFLKAPPPTDGLVIRVPIGKRLAAGAWVLFFGFLVGLPILHGLFANQALAVFDSFYRTGALVFGGGHVVLPLLQAAVVPNGWVTNEQFLAGYGAAQAVPGPLFTFSAYLGAVMKSPPNGWAGAGLALFAIFLPTFFMVVGAMPFWAQIRRQTAFRSALLGINAAVVGILLAALYNPVWTSAVLHPADFVLVLVDAALLMLWKLPPWAVVVVSAIGGAIIGLL